MTSVLMIVVVQVLIPLNRVLTYLTGPHEIGLVFYFLQHPVYGFLEHGINHRSVILGNLVENLSLTD